MRNAEVVQANIPIESSTGTRRMITLGARLESQERENGAEPIRIYNCTLIDLRNLENSLNPSGSTQRDFVAIAEATSGTFTDWIEENNVYYAPDMLTPQTTDNPVDTASQWLPSYKGRMAEGEGALQTQYANPAAAAIVPVLQTGSAAIGDATTGLTAPDDFFGNLRGTNPSRGALEPG